MTERLIVRRRRRDELRGHDRRPRRCSRVRGRCGPPRSANADYEFWENACHEGEMSVESMLLTDQNGQAVRTMSRRQPCRPGGAGAVRGRGRRRSGQTAAAPIAAVGRRQARSLGRLADDEQRPRGTSRITRRRSGVPAGQGVVQGGTIPYLPRRAGEAERKLQETRDRRSGNEVLSARRAAHHIRGFPFQIIQTARRRSTMLFEWAHATRVSLHERHPASARPYRLVDGRFARPVGRRHAGRRRRALQRSRRGSTGRATITAMRCTSSSATRRSTRITSTTRSRSTTRRRSRGRGRCSMILYRHGERNVQLLDYECYGFDVREDLPVLRN